MNTLYSVLQQIEATFGVRICVHDVSGITFTTRALALPYIWKTHGCAYCEIAKGFITERRCMQQKEIALRVLRRSGVQPFFGICNMGVCDYLQPVVQDGKTLAVVFASGVTREDGAAARAKLAAQAQKAGIPQAQALEAFDRFAATAATTRDGLRFFARLVCELILRDVVAGSARLAPPEGPYPVEAVPQRRMGVSAAVTAYLEECYMHDLSLKRLSALFFLSEGHLCRLVRQETGMSPMNYVKHLRIRAAIRELVETDRSVGDIGEQVGFGDTNYFCRCFRAVTGLTPTQYRRQRPEA